jgi:uncharacterized membrane-anchored protein YitT (DUF2179 family)
MLTKREHSKAPAGVIFGRFLFLILGAVIFSFGLEYFLIPNDIIDGGVTGISIMLSHLTGIPVGYYLFFLNIPFLIIGYRHIGKTFSIATFLGVALISILPVLFHQATPITNDPLLIAVFGGVTIGLGVGLVIRSGGSLDGSEIVSIIASRKLPFSVGEFIMIINVFILGSAGFVFGFEKAMYSIITYFIAYKTIDITVQGFDESRAIYVISDNYLEIGSAIQARLGRTVTYLNAEGGYSGDDKRVLFCVVTRLEETKIKTIIDEIDDQAFLAIGHIHDVKGGGFKKRTIH